LIHHFWHPGRDEFVGTCGSSIGALRNIAVEPFVVCLDAKAPELTEQARLAADEALALNPKSGRAHAVVGEAMKKSFP